MTCGEPERDRLAGICIPNVSGGVHGNGDIAKESKRLPCHDFGAMPTYWRNSHLLINERSFNRVMVSK